MTHKETILKHAKSPDGISRSEIAALHPEITPNTLKVTMKRLRQEGLLEFAGEHEVTKTITMQRTQTVRRYKAV